MHAFATRYFDIEDKEANDIKEFNELQALDPWVQRVVKNLQDDPEREGHKYFIIRDGVLWRRPERDHKNERLVVPNTLKRAVLRRFHGLPLTGHVGKNTTIKLLGTHFWWQGYTRDIAKWIKCCSMCTRRKTPRPSHAGDALTVTCGRPKHTYQMDILGPFPETSNGNAYVLTMIDIFTRWLMAVPIHNHKSSTIGEAIYRHVVCEHGVPAAIHTDRGRDFISKGILTMCDRFGIRKITTSGHQPQAMGHIERTHRFINGALTMLYNKHKNDWDFYLPAVVFAHRISPSEATGYSPFRLTYGADPVAPAERLYDLDDNRHMLSSEHEWADKLSAIFKDAYAAARVQQQNEADKNKARIEAAHKRVVPHYEPGDLVYFWEDKSELMPRSNRDGMVRVPHKLKYRWTGPHRVTAVGTMNTVKIQHTRHNEIAANINRLHICRPWSEHHASTDTDGPDINRNEDEKEEEPDDDRQEFRTQGDPLPGELIVFSLDTSEEGDLPFGVGSFINRATGCDCKSQSACLRKKCPNYYNFEWLGNFHERPDGVYRRTWIDNNQKFYHKDRPIHPSHKRATNEHSSTWITRDKIVAFGFSLTAATRLPASIYKLLTTDTRVQWGHPAYL